MRALLLGSLIVLIALPAWAATVIENPDGSLIVIPTTKERTLTRVQELTNWIQNWYDNERYKAREAAKEEACQAVLTCKNLK